MIKEYSMRATIIVNGVDNEISIHDYARNLGDGKFNTLYLEHDFEVFLSQVKEALERSAPEEDEE